MNEMIKRYIHDVTRRLPNKERGEVVLELEASINDMLPENPSQQDVNDVLLKLGAPRILAEQYRQNPRSLISPALFDTYISTLKTVASIVAVVGAIAGIIAAIPGSIFEIISSSIWTAFQSAIHTAFWVTFGFVLAGKTGYKPEAWKPQDLPALPSSSAIKIPRSSSIAGMALSVIFTIAIIALIVHGEWFFIMGRLDGEFIHAFSQAALHRAIPFIVLLGLVGLAANALKFYWQRWNLPVCLVNIAYNAIFVGIVAHILFWTDLLNVEFIEFVSSIFADTGIAIAIEEFPSRHLFLAIVIFAALIDIGSGILKTWKGMSR